jgi:hypothetical protein
VDVPVPILTLDSRSQLLTLTATGSQQYDQDRFREQQVGAFGANEPPVTNRPLLLDALAMVIRDDLAKSISPRRAASNIVRGFADQWQNALAHIEHRGQAWLFMAAQQSETVWFCAAGPKEGLPAFVAMQQNRAPLRRIIVVDIAALMEEIAARAKQAGLDLSQGTYYVAPDHPFHVEWANEFRQWREAKLRQFDPFYKKINPPRLSARHRNAVQELIKAAREAACGTASLVSVL